ncbi:VanZ family protein [Marinicrinis lubricantis]|uniref:VanZ family protein n=1 Tax=Marinicrinis lubricantis TaxID=2086470 RepID=A0ABW1IQW1_9BACL
MMKNIVGNIVMFIPYGFLVPILFHVHFKKMTAIGLLLCSLIGVLLPVGIEMSNRLNKTHGKGLDTYGLFSQYEESFRLCLMTIRLEKFIMLFELSKVGNRKVS